MQNTSNINIDTTIQIKCQDNKESTAIYTSLYPDNIKFPTNIELKMEILDTIVQLKIKFNSNKAVKNNIDTLINTIDEILEHTSIIKNVIKDD